MTKNNIIKNNDLKIFGLVLALFYSIFVYFFIQNLEYKLANIFLILILVLCSFFKPRLITSLYKIFLEIGKLLGYINTRVILFIIYYFLFLPYGTIFKLLGRDILYYKIEKNKNSYWKIVNDNNVKEAKDLKRPF